MLIKSCELSDGCRIHTVECSLELCVFEYHRLSRNVAGPLSYSEDRAVDRAAAVKPCSCCIDNSLIEVIVSVPFKHLARYACILLETVDYTCNRPRHCNARIRNTESHRITEPYLGRHSRLIGHFLHRPYERYYESVEVRSGNILEMTSRHDPGFKSIIYYRQIVFHCLLSCHSELVEDVIVRTACQDACLLDTHLLDYFEVFLLRTDPCRDLRELKPEILTCTDSFLIPVTVCEELSLSYYSFRSRQPGYELEYIHYLLCCIRLSRLLSVAERRVRDQDLLRHVIRARSEVETDLRHLYIFEELSEQVRLIHILYFIVDPFHLKKVGLSAEAGLSYLLSLKLIKIGNSVIICYVVFIDHSAILCARLSPYIPVQHYKVYTCILMPRIGSSQPHKTK